MCTTPMQQFDAGDLPGHRPATKTRIEDDPLVGGLEREQLSSQSADFAEGRAAFAQRRAAVFVGR